MAALSVMKDVQARLARGALDDSVAVKELGAPLGNWWERERRSGHQVAVLLTHPTDPSMPPRRWLRGNVLKYVAQARFRVAALLYNANAVVRGSSTALRKGARKWLI